VLLAIVLATALASSPPESLFDLRPPQQARTPTGMQEIWLE